jgi:hypothetical protein
MDQDIRSYFISDEVYKNGNGRRLLDYYRLVHGQHYSITIYKIKQTNINASNYGKLI